MLIKHHITLFLLFVLLLAGCAPAPQTLQVQEIQVIQAKERSISSQGMGEVRIRPDSARFTITVKTDESDLDTALKNNEKMTLEVLSILNKYEIADADIEIGLPSQEEGVFEPVRYFVRNNIKVVLRDLTKFEILLTEILRWKAYQISDVRFLISDITTYKDQALNLAVSDARNKAEIVATEIGREVGEVFTVYEVNQYGYETGIDWVSPNLEVEFPDAASQSYNELVIQVAVEVKFQLK